MNWKPYEEVHFSDQYILRWVREGDEYTNRITKEMMEDLQAVVRQQQAEIEALKAKTLTDKEIVEIYNDILIHDKKSSIKFAKAILRKAQEK